MLQSRPAGTLVERAAGLTPKSIANGVRGLSDRTIAWAFIAPTIVLLLAINIFPLFWAVRLSFTNYRANRPNAPLRWLGLEHYVDLLSDPDIWHAMQVTARFVLSTVASRRCSASRWPI